MVDDTRIQTNEKTNEKSHSFQIQLFSVLFFWKDEKTYNIQQTIAYIVFLCIKNAYYFM